MKISIIGNGNLAQNLVKTFQKNTYKLVEMYALDYQKLQEFCVSRKIHALKNIDDLNTDVDFLIISVSDRVLPQLLKQIPKGEYTVLHTSGALPISVFQGTKIKNYGVFYPLYSFLKQESVSFRTIPIMLEASNLSVFKRIKLLSENISENVLKVESRDRLWYHLSAVLVNNFSNHLWSMTQEILSESHLDFDHLKPILEQTCRRALDSDNIQVLQTGPAKRNDTNIIASHLSILEKHPDLSELYKKMSQLIIDKHKDTRI